MNPNRPPTMRAYLSKSKLLSYVQCPRRLYLEVNEPQLAQVSAGTKAIMATGNRVGEVARAAYPDGTLIESQSNLSEALRLTSASLAKNPRRPLFEATFQHDGTLVRADLLVPEKRYWHLVEVKSSTEVKDYHLADAAIQQHVLRAAGVALGEVCIQFINRDFVYPGNGNYFQVMAGGSVNSLFLRQEVSADIAPLVRKEVSAWIAGARTTLAGKIPPKTDRCNDPFECPFKGYCYPETTEYPVERLPHIGKKADALRQQGYIDIRDIPDGVLTNPKQERVRQATVTGKALLHAGAAGLLAKLGWPRYYLDFETIQFAVPIWKDTRPYQQLPFQWSCHVQRKDGSLEHREFLDLSGGDPTRAFADALVTAVGKRGPIVVYNQLFESGRIGELAQRYKDLAPALEAIRERLVDLLPITRDNYYHPAMKGSWSIKAVLPTIAPDLDYKNLSGVQHGGEAQEAYVEAIASETLSERRAQLRSGLLAYCERDTDAMVRLVRFLSTQRKDFL